VTRNFTVRPQSCFLFLLLVTLTHTPATLGQTGCGTDCGEERWPVKTLSDNDKAKVSLVPQDTTVQRLVSQTPPHNRPESARVAPVETRTYRVKAMLEGFMQEKDQDFHIVISDLRNPKTTMIVEIPNPTCSGACESGQSAAFAEARAAVERRFGHVPEGFERPPQPVPVAVTGVGFFDFKHHQIGRAKNAIELHPVLSIEFPGDKTVVIPVEE